MQYRFVHSFASRFCAFLSAALLFACNNASEPQAVSGTQTRSAPAAPLPSDPVTKAAAYSFIDACVESSKARIGDEAKAFAYCKCVEAQIRGRFGNTDSLTVANLQKDTARLAQIIQQCK